MVPFQFSEVVSLVLPKILYYCTCVGLFANLVCALSRYQLM